MMSQKNNTVSRNTICIKKAATIRSSFSILPELLFLSYPVQIIIIHKLLVNIFQVS